MKRPVNFRDLAEVRLPGGRKIKEHRLLRSGEVTDIDQKDRKTLLSTYGLKTVVDLRTAVEAARKPDDKLPGVSIRHIDVMETAEDKVANMESARRITTAGVAREYMLAVYETMILDERAQKGYAEFVRLALGQKEGALLFHCFAGKDRTGLAAAILLTMLGAGENEIFHDYMLTNEMRKDENESILKKERLRGASKDEIEITETLLSVESSYLECAFDTATKHFGSFEGFVRQRLDVDDKAMESLSDNYTYMAEAVRA